MLNGKAYSSSGRPSKEITYAQWLALPDTKYTNGIVYYIKDIGGANQFPPLIYSDEEREIGVWRDGKPLYQRTFVYSASDVTNNNMMTDILASDVDEIMFDLSASYLRTLDQGSGDVLIKSISYYDPLNNQGVRILKTGTYIGFTQFRSTTSNNVFDGNSVLSIKYTKTTDQPGSGTWTTDGTYAKHYSTSEKVVGTWIDGKPIYEKVLTFTVSDFPIVSDWTSLDSSINGDKLIDINLIIGIDGSESRSLRLRNDSSDILPRFAIVSGNFCYYTNTNNFPYNDSRWTWRIIIQYTKTIN